MQSDAGMTTVKKTFKSNAVANTVFHRARAVTNST
jgi:hypothetical protein